MREMLFRGKKSNGEWVFGSLILAKNYCCILQDEEKIHEMDYPYLDGDLGTFDGQATPVIPETVGQFTGLTDKNGKKIFEGDILSERPPMNQIAYIGCVVYDEKSAVWRFLIKNDKKYNGVLLGSYSSSYKVIGNIHDNPEVLKEGETE